MNWRFIINMLVIILIIYLIINSLDINFNFNLGGFIREGYCGDDSIKFLIGEDKYDPTEELLDYINNNGRDIRGLGYYRSAMNEKDWGEENTPYFESNVTDINSFFNLNMDLEDCSQMKFDGIDFKKIQKQNKQTNALQIPERETFEQIRRNHGMSVNDPTQWNYKNEKPMNGGKMDGIIGYVDDKNDYAQFNKTYDNNMMLNKNEYENCVPQSNDLRFERQNYSN